MEVISSFCYVGGCFFCHMSALSGIWMLVSAQMDMVNGFTL